MLRHNLDFRYAILPFSECTRKKKKEAHTCRRLECPILIGGYFSFCRCVHEEEKGKGIGISKGWLVEWFPLESFPFYTQFFASCHKIFKVRVNKITLEKIP